MSAVDTIPTFDDVLAALLDASVFAPMGSVVRAGEESPGAHRQLSHDDVIEGRPTTEGDRATVYPNGWSGGAWNLETYRGELVLCADYAEPGNNQERAWHITPPTDPMCVGKPVFALADAVREAAAFIGLLPHDANTK